MRWLVHLAKTGYLQRKGELLDLVREIVEDDQRKTPFSDRRNMVQKFHAPTPQDRGSQTKVHESSTGDCDRGIDSEVV